MIKDAGYARRIYSLLASMYLCKPTREAILSWRELLETEPLAGTEELLDALRGINVDSEQELDDILWEYTRLFIGPHHLHCPPYESVYTSPKRLLMQDAYLQVQEFYSRIGVEVGSEDVMADHIGVELNFLVVLFSIIENDPENRPLRQGLLEEFLAGHLQNWVPSFAADMEESSETSLYKALAKVTMMSLL